MEAPTPRKSKRVPISLTAWLSALSTSCRLILDTTSKEDSDATGPRLDGLGPAGMPVGCFPRRTHVRLDREHGLRRRGRGSLRGRGEAWPALAVGDVLGEARAVLEVAVLSVVALDVDSYALRAEGRVQPHARDGTRAPGRWLPPLSPYATPWLHRSPTLARPSRLLARGADNCRDTGRACRRPSATAAGYSPRGPRLPALGPCGLGGFGPQAPGLTRDWASCGAGTDSVADAVHAARCAGGPPQVISALATAGCRSAYPR